MEDNKTVTMPLSEYRRMEEIVANYKNCEKKIYKEAIDLYEKSLKDLREGYDKYYDKAYQYGKRIDELEKELAKYKQKKWWQIWKK